MNEDTEVNCGKNGRLDHNATEGAKTWLVVWNMNYIFPYIGNDHPN
jgi:hypothetical protein